MVRQSKEIRKQKKSRFLGPCWHEHSPEFVALDQRLPADHLARLIQQGIGLLDLAPLRDAYAGSGSLAYPPELLLTVVLYEWQEKRPRPSQGARDTLENEPVRWLLRGLTPTRTVWYDFRKRLSEQQLLDWHRQILERAVQQKMTTAQQGALDGTLVAANASRHKLAKEKKLQERLGQLEQMIAADESGQALSALPVWMAKSPARRIRQRDLYRRAWQRMQEKQERNRQKRSSKRQDPDKIRVSISDADAAVGYDKLDVYRPLYNVQLVADLQSPLVLAYDVFAQTTDAGLLGPMLERQRTLVGWLPQGMIADAGYASGDHLALAKAMGVTLIAPWQSNDYTARKAKPVQQLPKKEFTWNAAEQTYYCPQGQRLLSLGARAQKRSGPDSVVLEKFQCPKEICQNCPLKAKCTTGNNGRTISRSEHEELIDELQERLKTPEAKALLRQRGATVERLNAEFKEHRGLQRFSGRGLKNAKIEVGLLALSHNLRLVIKHQQSSKMETTPTETSGKIAV